MIADGKIFNNGPKMNMQESGELAEIERKIQDREYELNDSDSKHSEQVYIKDENSKEGENLFFATEIETNYVG